MGRQRGNQNSMNMDRMNIQQESKQQPTDKQSQTWARQILSITGLNTVSSDIYNSLARLKIDLKNR